jgi:hypothetical protein
MYTKLRDKNLLPKTQPYNYAPFSYTGTETVTGTMPTDITDWVLVEIKNPAGVIVDKKAALLKSNGLVIEADGSNPSGINLKAGVTAGNYTIIVRHRNHLAISTEAPILLKSGANVLDFTVFDFTPNNNVYLSNQVLLKTGVYGMRKANVNGNNATNALDRSVMRGVVDANNVYRPSDLNLDGVVNSIDRTISRLEVEATDGII